MRHRILVLSFVLTMVMGGASVEANPFVIAGDTVRLAPGPGTTGGGEFIVTVNDAWSFITFCLQRTQYINFTDPFNVDAVSTYATWEAPDHGGDALGRDYLSPQTAFLYTKFSDGTLTGYNFAGPNRATSADQLQNAIWMLEDELPMDPSNQFVTLANSAVNNGLWSGLGEVRALNLSKDGVGAQDQLGTTPVPEPATLLLVGSGFLAVARRSRVRRPA